MLHAFLLAWLGCCAAQASPGPNMMAVAEVALAQGRRASLLVVAGIATGSLVWAGAAALGLGALFAALPVLLTILKIAGGLYLLFVALRALRSAWLNEETDIVRARSKLTTFAAWQRGFYVVMTNPKAALMWSAVATFLFGAGLVGVQVLLFGPVVAVSALVIYGGYGLLFSTGVAGRVYDRFARAVNAAFGAAFGALGVTLLLSGIGDVRP